MFFYTIFPDHNGSLYPFIAGFLLIGLLVLTIRTRHPSYVVCCAIFGVYLMFALDRAFFPLRFDPSNSGEVYDLTRFVQSINLIPFYVGPESSFTSMLGHWMLNALLTLPFGFGISFVLRTNFRQILLIMVEVGGGIEFCQFVLSLVPGMYTRSIDINDVLMNTLGVLIGYGLFRLFAWLYIGATKLTGIRHWGITAYIYDVASRASMPSPATPTP